MTTSTADMSPALRSLPLLGRKVALTLASGHIFFWGTLWLIVLLVAGTIAQADIGLYEAQHQYFSAWVTFFGPIPTPGGGPTMALLVVNLTASLIFKSHWRWNRLGVIIAHIGSLLLFIGGFITAATATEGSLMIPEGERSATVRDYHAIELAVIETTNPTYDDVTAFGGGLLEAGATLSNPAFPFQMRLEAYSRNATAAKRKAPSADGKAFAAEYELQPLAQELEHERNRAGLTLRLTGAGPEDGQYLFLQDMNVPQALRVGDRTFQIELRGRQYELPFTIELLDFQKKVHPGTGMAKAFSSSVNLIDGGVTRPVLIQMNEPLRHQGFTLYQSSYIQGRGPETTVLAVVANEGRLFPYISSIVICIGLLIHLVLQIPRLIGRRDA